MHLSAMRQAKLVNCNKILGQVADQIWGAKFHVFIVGTSTIFVFGVFYPV